MRSKRNGRLILGDLKGILQMVYLGGEARTWYVYSLVDKKHQEGLGTIPMTRVKHVVEIMEQERIVWAREYNGLHGFLDVSRGKEMNPMVISYKVVHIVGCIIYNIKLEPHIIYIYF